MSKQFKFSVTFWVQTGNSVRTSNYIITETSTDQKAATKKAWDHIKRHIKHIKSSGSRSVVTSNFRTIE